MHETPCRVMEYWAAGDAISMQSACDQYAIKMQSVCDQLTA
jgi:hypothetical protein